MHGLKHLIYFPDGEKVSRSGKAASLMIASMVNTLLTLLLSMIATRVLTKTELALNSQTFLVYTTVSSILAMGIPSGLYYHLSHNENRKRAAVSEGVAAVAFSCIVFSAFVLLGGNELLASAFQNPGMAELLYYLVPYTLFMVPLNVLSCVFVFENRIRFNAIFSALRTFVVLVIVAATVLLFRTGKSMVISRVSVSVLFAAVAAVIVYRILLKGDHSKMEMVSLKRLLAISVPLGLAAVVSTLDLSLDKWIISVMLSPEAYAVYTQGARELPLISTFTGAVSTVMIVDITKSAKNGDYATATGLFRNVAEKTSLVLLPLMMFFLVSANPFIRFLYTDSYVNAIPVFQVYLFYLPIRTVLYGPLLIALGKSRYIMIRSVIGLCLNAVLSVIAVRLFGELGAAGATIAVLYLFNVPVNLYQISKRTGVKWTKLLPFKRMGLCCLLSLPGMVLCVIARLLVTASLSPLFALITEAFLFFSVTGLLLIKAFKLPVRDYCRALFKRFRISRIKNKEEDTK